MYRIQSNERQYSVGNGYDQSKYQMINFIYSRINLSHFKYDLLEVESELSQLVSKKFFVSANFSGTNCLLVFAKIKDRYHSFLVDRKTLKYDINKVNTQDVKITNVKVKLDLDIYQGSIFDGIFVQGKNEKTFIITDTYVFKGQDVTKSQLDTKLLTVLSYLKSSYNDSDRDNDIIITVNKLYELDQTENLVKNIIPKIKNFNVRGICFYPIMSSTKLIYRFDNDTKKQNDFVDSVSNINGSNSKTIKYNCATNNKREKDDRQPSPSNSHGSDSGKELPKPPEIKKIMKTVYEPKKGYVDTNYVFEMKKTDNVDVYMLNVVESVYKDNKTYMKRKHVGLALVPNVSRSKWCREIMENTDGNILVNCKYHYDKKKWEPIMLSENSKRPSFLNDFEITTIEE